MKTSNQPRPVQVSLDWIASLNGQLRLCLLVDTDTASATYKHCMKAGKRSTLIEFYSNAGSPAGWTIMSYAHARDWILNINEYNKEVTTVNESTVVDIVATEVKEDLPMFPEVSKYPPAVVPQVTLGSLGMLDTIIDCKIETKVNDCVSEAMKHVQPASAAVMFEVKPSADAPVIPLGTVHKHFSKLLKMCAARGPDGNRLNTLLVGPAGTSKSTSAKQVAKALNLPFYPHSAIADEYKLFGFRNAMGEVVRTMFREGFEHGGVILFDELSASDENAFLSLNGVLANGICAFPDAIIERHPDCIIIAGDNVLGGATADYNARNKMDDSSVDRFVIIDWPIDVVLERAITGNDEWVTLVQSFRSAVDTLGIKALITPRASFNGAALMRAGMSKMESAEATMRKGMDDPTWKRVCKHVGLSID